MRELLAQFHEKGTRDELGLAGIRDAFADLLFPGTGALQTRARYFFFVPWMYQLLERKGVPASEVTARGRNFEIDLIGALKTTEMGRGIIGVRAGRNLQRLPSSIYWAGLGRLGILRRRVSQEQFHRNFGRRSALIKDDDGDLIANEGERWHLTLPSRPEGFPKATAFALTEDEAVFLKSRVRDSAPNSFFSWWLNENIPGKDKNFAWDVPREGLPPHLERQLTHARNFSEVMHGAAILYSFLLAQKQGMDDLSEELSFDFEEWFQTARQRHSELILWDLRDFWRCVEEAGGRVAVPTRDFVAAWWALWRTAQDASTLRTDANAEQLICRRERDLKKALARFDNQRALELWRGAVQSQLDFRWSSAKVLGRDIQTGLSERPNAE